MPIPPLIALGAIGLIGAVALSPAPPDDHAKPIAQRILQVVPQADQSLVITDIADHEVIGHVPGGGESFMRGVFHSLIGFRHLHGIGPDRPYRLAELSDGRVVLVDPTTSTTIDLEGFGAGNASKFTALLGLPPLKEPL